MGRAERRTGFVNPFKPAVGAESGTRGVIVMAKKIAMALTAAFVFGALYAASKTYLDGLYLFEWTARHRYLYSWAAAVILAFAGRGYLSFALTAGNAAGIFCGQFMGDRIKETNMLKITPGMDAGTAYQLQHHPGVEIWLSVVLIFLLVSIIIHKIRMKRKL